MTRHDLKEAILRSIQTRRMPIMSELCEKHDLEPEAVRQILSELADAGSLIRVWSITCACQSTISTGATKEEAEDDMPETCMRCFREHYTTPPAELWYMLSPSSAL